MLKFSAPSVAVHVTVVSPGGKAAGASLVGVQQPSPSTASLADATPMSTVVMGPVACAVTSAGMARVGAVVSSTVTFCGADAEFPASSVAVQVTTVVPRGNFAGASLVIAISATALTSSVAVAVPMDTVVKVSVASSNTSEGAVTVGASLLQTSRRAAYPL